MSNEPGTDLAAPADGHGRLLQRDYWAVIAGCDGGPRHVADLLRTRFWEFPPAELVTFARADGRQVPLQTGDEMVVEIRMAGTFRVRILHQDANSITIGTVKGHPEAGRITFGAYRNPNSDVVFHIRSIAKAGSLIHLASFKVIGEAMQTNTWTDFITSLAAAAGSGVHGDIHADTAECAETDADDMMKPTFLARGE
jgi:hypothetical protein